MIILFILGFILLLIILIILPLFLIPFDYHVEGQKYESASITAYFSLMLGGIRFYYIKNADKNAVAYMTLFGFRLNEKYKKTHKEKEIREKKKKKKGKVNYFKKEFLKRLFQAIGEVFQQIKPKSLKVCGEFGFDEPYDTAMIWLLILALPLHRNHFDISLHPVFDDEILEGRFIIEGRMTLIVILWIAVRFRLSRPVKNILKERKRKVYAS